MNTPLPADCDCTCDGVIGVVVCPPPTMPIPDTPSRPRHRRNVPPGQQPRRGRPLRDGRGGDRLPDRPTLPVPRTMPIPPKWLPEGNPWDFDENDPNPVPQPPSPDPPGGTRPDHRTNTSPRGIDVVANQVKRGTREGGIIDRPTHSGPRTIRPKREVDRKYPVDTNDNSGPTPNPGSSVNNQ